MNGVEQERLKQAVDRLIDAQREALDVIAEGLGPDVEGLKAQYGCSANSGARGGGSSWGWSELAGWAV